MVFAANTMGHCTAFLSAVAVSYALSHHRNSTDAGEDQEEYVDLMDCGDELAGVKDKFEGGVLASDGCICGNLVLGCPSMWNSGTFDAERCSTEKASFRFMTAVAGGNT